MSGPMTDEDDRLGRLSSWLIGAFGPISDQVHVRTLEHGKGTQTAVAIDHRLACPLDEHDGWRITTQPTFLPLAHFSSQARHYLKTADASRGRTIYCHDLSLCEVVAALSYHIDDDPRLPVLITTIGLRTDAGVNAFLTYRSLAGALVAKQYVHAVAAKTERGGFVDIDLAERSNEPLVRRLGFGTAPRIKGFRPGGVHLRQQAAGS